MKGFKQFFEDTSRNKSMSDIMRALMHIDYSDRPQVISDLENVLYNGDPDEIYKKYYKSWNRSDLEVFLELLRRKSVVEATDPRGGKRNISMNPKMAIQSVKPSRPAMPDNLIPAPKPVKGKLDLTNPFKKAKSGIVGVKR